LAAKNPNETMGQLIAAINGGEPERALTLYEQDAVFVTEPGKFAAGKNAIRDAHQDAYGRLKASFRVNGERNK
jgi:uncharacterized protein (TIGR02246 family)